MLQVELTGWEAMIHIEPLLGEVVRVSTERCLAGQDPIRVYEIGKRNASALIGWDAKDERLGSSECYEIFVCKLADAVGV